MSKEQKENKESKWEKFVNWVNGEEAVEFHNKYQFKPFDFYDIGKNLKSRAYKEKEEKKVALYRFSCVLVCVVFIAILLTTVQALPYFGNSDNPASNEVVERYIESGVAETGATNIVAGMILDYRAFDTFGESAVLFLSVICVVMLLRRDKNNISAEEDREMEEDDAFEEADGNVILKRMAGILVPIIFLYGMYVILNGHLSPGGGFSGGAIVGTSLILYSSAYGYEKVHSFFNFKTFTNISVTCLLTYCGAKGYSFFTGANHLPNIIPKGIPGNILSAGLILPLNICVGMIVACTMYSFYALFTKGEI